MKSFDFFVCAFICVAIFIILSTFVVMKYIYGNKKLNEQSEELSGERKLYGKLYDGISEVFIILEASSKIPAYVSEGSKELLGIKRSDIMADIYVLKRGVSAAMVSGFNEEYAKWDKKGIFTREFDFIQLETGEKKIGKLKLSFSDKEDSIYISISDITAESEERRNIHNELDQIKNLNKYRNEFISNISHEIRTPITSIQGQLKLAGMNANNPSDVKRYTDGVSEQTNKLLAILNDMFDISRMETGDITLENNEFDIKALAKKLQDTYEASSAAMGLKFSINMSDMNARYFMGDDLRLQQILIAFIENAQEKTPQGGEVSLSIRQMNRRENSVNILFRIKDMGKRLTQKEAMDVLGTGTGGNIVLAVAYQLINVMGGQTMFNSSDSGNDYSLFLTFNMADREQDMSAPIDTADSLVNKAFTFEGCKILLAEDNETNAEIAKEILEMMGAQVDIAENGQIAFEKFINGGEGRYHAILMDIQMPVMDGLQATRKIRGLYGAEAKTIPIFALSANAFVEDKQRSLEAGMNGHIAKPIDFDILKNEMAKYL